MAHSFRLAHLSDLHFSKISLDFKQFFSKRWIGNLNFLLRRRKDFDYRLLDSIPSLLQEQKVDLVVISGDLTCTSSEDEFSLATTFLQKLKQAGLEVVVIPGNHDHYTKNAYTRKLFYQFCPDHYGSKQWDLKNHQVCAKHLSDRWWMLLLDTTLSTPLLCSHGKFSESLEKHFQDVLSSLPSDAQIIIANHFSIDGKNWRPTLRRNKAFFEILKAHPQVKFYLHGHDHKHRITDLRAENLPISVDAGSTTLKTEGSWVLMDCQDKGCSFQPFLWDIQKSSWIPSSKLTSFTW